MLARTRERSLPAAEPVSQTPDFTVMMVFRSYQCGCGSRSQRPEHEPGTQPSASVLTDTAVGEPRGPHRGSVPQCGGLLITLWRGPDDLSRRVLLTAIKTVWRR